MIRIAHEAPVEYIRLVQSRTDIDFALAHHVLANEEYRKAYLYRDSGRQLILDNSFFELGSPISLPDLVKASFAVCADWVISPDVLGDFERTTAMLKETLKYSFCGQLAAVMSGRDASEIAECYRFFEASGRVKMYCWAFGSDRVGAIKLLNSVGGRHHLLGFSTLDEIIECERELSKRGATNISLDTWKPVSAAHCGEVVRDAGRGTYKRPELGSIINTDLLQFNLGVFRGWIHGGLARPIR